MAPQRYYRGADTGRQDEHDAFTALGVEMVMRSVGIDVEFEVLDWEALRNRRRLGAAAPENRDRHGLNSSWAYWDPDIGLIGPGSTFMAALRPPNRWGCRRFRPSCSRVSARARNGR